MSIIVSSLPVLLKASLVTLILAVVSMAFGLLIGILIALARISKVKLISRSSLAYISIMRGTPLLVQLYIIYFGLPQIGIKLDPITSGILGLSLNTGAYLAESFRSAIESIDKGQMEAAVSLGLTHSQAMRRIIIPQSIRTAVPNIGNIYIGLLKDTSLVSVITVTELLQETTLIIANTFQPLTLYVLAALLYWVMSYAFSVLQRRVETRVSRHVRL